MDPVTAKYIVSDIISRGYERTPWERRFLRSVKKYIEQGVFLRGQQPAYLREIHKKSKKAKQGESQHV